MRIYFFRHGQAGLRHSYDTLSDLGVEQSRRLGAWLAAEGVRFRAVLTGALERQRQTAEEACRAAREHGLEIPKPAVEERWNEFDLDGVYREIVPRLRASDAAFARDYERLDACLADPHHPAHHAWVPSDVAIVRAWIEERFQTGVESWAAFNRRIAANLGRLPSCGRGEAIAVFTSATPVAIWMGMALDIPGPKLMPLAGVMHNTALSAFRYREGELMLLSFNATPHLAEPRLRTFR